MKPYRPLYALAVAAAVAMISAATAFVGAAVDRSVAVWRGVKAFAAEIAIKIVAAVPETDAGATTASLRGFVRHQAYRLRQIKRETPRIEQGWRMCPSA